MAVVPRKQRERIDWFYQRVNIWQTNQQDLGFTQQEIQDFSALATQADLVWHNTETAKQASKNATLELEGVLQALSAKGAGMVEQIKAKAKADNNPNLFILADVPPPAPPTPAGVPNPPTAVVGTLNTNGDVTVSWKGSLAKSTFYNVYRRLNSTGTFTLVGSVAAKQFVDSTIPSGCECASYRVSAQRGTVTSAQTEVAVWLYSVPLAQAA